MVKKIKCTKCPACGGTGKVSRMSFVNPSKKIESSCSLCRGQGALETGTAQEKRKRKTATRLMTTTEIKLRNKVNRLQLENARRLIKLVDLRRTIANINEACVGDHESGHRQVDEALLDYIGDAEVRKLFDAVSRWYA